MVGRVGSGERAVVSSCGSFVATSAVVVMRRPDVSSFRIERSMGSVVEYLTPVAARRINVCATFGFFTKNRRRDLP